MDKAPKIKQEQLVLRNGKMITRTEDEENKKKKMELAKQDLLQTKNETIADQKIDDNLEDKNEDDKEVVNKDE